MTRKQIFGTVLALLLACFLSASKGWLNSLNPPSLTPEGIAKDTLGLLFVGFIVKARGHS